MLKQFASRRLTIILLLILTSAVSAQSAVPVSEAKALSDEKINVFEMKKNYKNKVEKLTHSPKK